MKNITLLKRSDPRDAFVTRHELAIKIAVQLGEIDRAIAKGMPCYAFHGRKLFDLPTVTSWMKGQTNASR